MNEEEKILLATKLAIETVTTAPSEGSDAICERRIVGTNVVITVTARELYDARNS